MLSLVRRARRRVGSRESGVTLVELMVTMTISVILAVAALGMFLATNKATSANIDSNLSSTSARGALDSWTALLQTATLPGLTTPFNATTNPGGAGQVFASLTPTSVMFYTNLGNRSTSTSGALAAATLIKLEWRARGQSICPTNASIGCLIETKYSTTTTAITVLSARVLLSGVSVGAVAGSTTATSGCGDGSTVPTTRLFTACGITSSALGTYSAACATPCASTDEDPSVLTTANFALNTYLPSPSSIVIAFTVSNYDTNRDGSRAAHVQSYISAAAVTGLLSTGTQSSS